MEYRNLIELAKTTPNINVTISLGELIEAVEHCVQTTRKELEQQIIDSNAETYPSIDKVAEMLNVTKTTLWRWHKRNYLVPIEVGGKRRYRMSDIKKILEKR